jgi:hypothetical protein
MAYSCGQSTTEEEIMATSGHLASLASKHAQLESLIDAENQRPYPDDIQIAQWKKEKLKLKDEMLRQVH